MRQIGLLTLFISLLSHAASPYPPAHVRYECEHYLSPTAHQNSEVAIAIERAKHVRRYLPVILDAAFWNTTLSDDDAELIEKLHTGLYHEQSELQFLSFSRDPLPFSNLEANRVAATGDRVGDTVYMNTDLITELSFEQMVSILVHEYGHHHGIKDESLRSLDTLGAKVARVLAFEAVSLSHIGLSNLQITKFWVEDRPPYQEYTKRGRMAAFPGPHVSGDGGKGTHFFLSDGKREVNLRGLLRDKFSVDKRFWGLKIEPLNWRVESDESHRALVLEATLYISGHPRTVEIKIPFFDIRPNSDILEFERTEVRDIAPLENSNLPDWFRASLFPMANQKDITGEDIVIRDLGDRVEVEFTIEGRPLDMRPEFPKYLQLWNLYWYSDRVYRQRLPSGNPLSCRGRIIKREEIGEDKLRLTVELPAAAKRFEDLKLFGILLDGKFTPNVGYIDRRVIHPENILTLKRNAELDPNAKHELTHVGPQSETVQHFEISSKLEPDFTLTINEEEEFPIHSLDDLEKFYRDGGIISAKFENPNENFGSDNSPFYLATALRVGTLIVPNAGHVVHPAPGQIALPMAISPSLYFCRDYLKTRQLENHFQLADKIVLTDLFFKTPDLRVWHLPVRVEMNFTQVEVPNPPSGTSQNASMGPFESED